MKVRARKKKKVDGGKKKGFLHRLREMTQLVACMPTDDIGWILELTLKKSVGLGSIDL